VWFPSDQQSIKFLQLGHVEDASRSSDTRNIRTITTNKLRKAAALTKTLSMTYNPSAGNFEEESMQYIATVKEEVFTRPD
jgi:hypothetical protein